MEFLADVDMIDPYQVLCQDSLSTWAYDNKVSLCPLEIPPNNLYQRIHVSAVDLAEILKGVDLVITFNEFGGFPIRALRSDIKIIQWNSLPPEYPWPWMAPGFYPHWRSADLIVCQAEAQRKIITEHADRHKFGGLIPDIRV